MGAFGSHALGRFCQLNHPAAEYASHVRSLEPGYEEKEGGRGGNSGKAATAQMCAQYPL